MTISTEIGAQNVLIEIEMTTASVDTLFLMMQIFTTAVNHSS